MKAFEPFTLDLSAVRAELDELHELLKSPELSERKDILPFFRRRKHLSAFLGSYNPKVLRFDRLAFEFDIFGDFVSDLAVGDSVTQQYCFVEFEDASRESIFQRRGRKETPEWASRFERGYSQIIDWFHVLDDLERTGQFKRRFGSEHISYVAVLAIGRSAHLDDACRQRLRWRYERVVVNSRHVSCITFDELYEDLSLKLQLITSAAKAER